MMSRTGLRTKVLLGIVGIVVLLGFGVIIIAKPALQRKLFDTLQKRGVSLAKGIAANSINPILTEQYFELKMMLKDSMSSEDDIVYIFVLDNRGKVLVHTFEDGFPRELRDVNKADATQKYSLQRITTEKGEIIDIAVPLLKGEVGSVHVGISGERIKEDVNSIVKSIIWLFIAVLILGAAMGNIMSRVITRRISDLTKAARAVGRGNLDLKVPVTSNDEIGQLGTTFNDMLQKRKEAEEVLRESEERYRSVVDNIGIGIVVISPAKTVLSMNSQMKKWFPDTDVSDMPVCYRAFNNPPREAVCSYCPTSLTLNDGKVHETITDTPEGEKIVHYRLISSPIKGKDGRVIAAVEMVEDITERKRAEEQIRSALREKEILLKEIHHRVKNNLQVIASMLQLQSGYIHDEEARILFGESQKRIESMSLIHEKLYRTKDLARIDFREYVDELGKGLMTLNTGGSGRMEIKVDIEGVILDISHSIPCGLIINELVSNALRHAFPGGGEGRIAIRMRRDKEGIVALTVSDNGIGFPENIDFRNTGSLGMQLIISLVSQLEGTIELQRNRGTSFAITFQGMEI
jgi:PAS domain S-box-containing protein